MAKHNWSKEFDKRAKEELRPSKKRARITIVNGEGYKDFLSDFLSKLNCLSLTYSYVKNPSTAQWLFQIDGLQYILKADKHTKIAYLEGWIPEYEELNKGGVYSKNGGIDPDTLTTRKNEAIKRLKTVLK